ncbi:MAG: serine/threonine-protein kinase [Isosphaeraceae bacterium]|nr:serine/threonine-protein kinase [Isosphaeraceae bacterium]
MPRNPLPNESSNHETLAWEAGRTAEARDLTGTTLGDFEIERRLGRGGMGEVYLARQKSLNREVAIKVIRPDLVSSTTALARFRKEVLAAAKLSDPNIVHIHMVDSIDDLHFFVMEYVPGTTLKDYLDRKGPPELPLALSIMKQAGNALRAAAEGGLIHRDIKPENILVTRRGLVKVADFGLCRDSNDAGGPSITQPEVAMGTPLYMSPEQAQGFPLDHRSDLYSLGVTFFHLLSGRPPFQSDSPIALAVKHVKDAPPDLAAIRSDLPPELCRLVMRLMEKDPAARYQSAAEMLRDLARIKENSQANSLSGQNVSIGIPTAAIPPSPPISNPSGAQAGPTPSSARASTVAATALNDEVEPSRHRLRHWPKVAAVMLLLLGALGGWQSRPRDLLSPAAAAAPQPTPALWMFPDWSKIPKRPTPQAQYRYALIEADVHSREAAWVAVAGHHPLDKEWTSKAYTQLGRELFQARDVSKLRVFADELERTSRGHDDRLAEILRVGIGVLDRDADRVLNIFGRREDFIGTLADPALAELCLEITNDALIDLETASLSPSTRNRLVEIQRNLIFRMMEITLRDTFGRAPF